MHRAPCASSVHATNSKPTRKKRKRTGQARENVLGGKKLARALSRESRLLRYTQMMLAMPLGRLYELDRMNDEIAEIREGWNEIPWGDDWDDDLVDVAEEYVGHVGPDETDDGLIGEVAWLDATRHEVFVEDVESVDDFECAYGGDDIDVDVNGDVDDNNCNQGSTSNKIPRRDGGSKSVAVSVGSGRTTRSMTRYSDICQMCFGDLIRVAIMTSAVPILSGLENTIVAAEYLTTTQCSHYHYDTTVIT